MAINKQNFISGSIFELKLPLNLGYAYCKVLDFRYIREFDGIIVKVYDLIVSQPLTDINVLIERDWLFGGRRLYDLPNTRGKGAWKFKGVLISIDDNNIPDFKDSPKDSPLIKDESSIKPWYVVKNLREKSNVPCEYEQVRHLENTIVGSTIGIEIRTAMEILRIKGEDVASFFDLEDMANWNNYKAMINVPIYKTIPRDIRGKALCT